MTVIGNAAGVPSIAIRSRKGELNLLTKAAIIVLLRTWRPDEEGLRAGDEERGGYFRRRLGEGSATWLRPLTSYLRRLKSLLFGGVA